MTRITKVHTWTTCRNCGGEYGIHQSETSKCPLGGNDQTGQRKEIYLDTTFAPELPRETPANVTQTHTYKTRIFKAVYRSRHIAFFPNDVAEIIKVHASLLDIDVLIDGNTYTLPLTDFLDATAPQ